METVPKLVLHKETLRVLDEPTAENGVVLAMRPPETRGYCTATCYTCYGTCTC